MDELFNIIINEFSNHYTRNNTPPQPLDNDDEDFYEWFSSLNDETNESFVFSDIIDNMHYIRRHFQQRQITERQQIPINSQRQTNINQQISNSQRQTVQRQTNINQQIPTNSQRQTVQRQTNINQNIESVGIEIPINREIDIGIGGIQTRQIEPQYRTFNSYTYINSDTNNTFNFEESLMNLANEFFSNTDNLNLFLPDGEFNFEFGDDVKVVLSDQEFNNLENICINENNLKDFSGNCTVCLDEFELGQNITLLKCKHYFHKDCLKNWLTKQSTKCCTCRFDCRV
jgi:hypothetical protein